jgi:hypothetical protein
LELFKTHTKNLEVVCHQSCRIYFKSYYRTDAQDMVQVVDTSRFDIKIMVLVLHIRVPLTIPPQEFSTAEKSFHMDFFLLLVNFIVETVLP